MQRVLLAILLLSVSACAGKKVIEPDPEVNVCLVDAKNDELLCVENFGERKQSVFPVKDADNWVCVDPKDKGEIEFHHRRLHRLLEQ